jgi:predicted  nucleic acid-binding Zn-ribbon protein
MNEDPKTIAELRNQVAELEAKLDNTIDGARKRIEELELQDRKTQEELRNLSKRIDRVGT